MNFDEDQIRKYLADNQSFTKEWFVQNATNEFIREWFNERRKQFSEPVQLNIRDADKSPGPIMETIHKSLINDKQSGNLYLSPFHNQIPLTSNRNSILTEVFNDIVDSGFSKKNSSKKTEKLNIKKKFGGLSDEQLMMELIMDITNELNVEKLCHKILVNVSILTNSDRASLFLAKGNRNNRYLIAKLFDVTPDSLLEDALISNKNDNRNIPPIPFGTGIVGHVALTKQNVNIKNAYEDPRFNKNIDKKTGYQTKSLICQPIVNFGGDVIGVAECINKLTNESIFSEKDEEIFKKYLTFCGVSIQNAQLFEMSLLEYKRYHLLLSLAKTIFEDTTKLEPMITKIMIKTKVLLDCDKSRVYIVNKNDKSKNIFDWIFELNNEKDNVTAIKFNEENFKNDIPLSNATEAASSRKTLNSDSSDLFKSENISILSVPIFNNENKVLGVAQLIKIGPRTIFTDVETSVIEAFAIFCGLGLQSCMMYEEAVKLNAHQQVSLEILSYHASASEEETIKLMEMSVPNADTFNLKSFDFDDLKLSDDDTTLACLRIFIDLDLISKFQIPYKVLCKWILTTKKNYRNVIYHNWRHAFNVAQTMFVIIDQCKMKDILEPKEQLALIVASICHDLDHRGFTNAFNLKTFHPLTKIYNASYLENHHFHHAMLVLNSNGNNIFENIPLADRQDIIRMIEECILSTDFAQYFTKKGKFVDLVHSNQMNLDEPGKKELLMAMLMTACDLAAICKPWDIQKRVAQLVANEFFLQGDLERGLNMDPLPMMDRKQKDNLPQGQVSFIDSICLQLYETLFEYWPELEPLYAGCINNRQQWQSSIGLNNNL